MKRTLFLVLLLLVTVALARCGSSGGGGSGTVEGALYPAALYAVGEEPLSVVTADIDGDGKIDIATANNEGGDISILLGNGESIFQEPVSLPVGEEGLEWLIFEDVNGDGNSDFVVTQHADDDTVIVLLGNGDGTFQSPVASDTGSGAQHLIAADFDNDDMIDLATAGNDGITVLMGHGDGTFAVSQFYAIDWGVSVATADFDGDGILDLAAPSHSNFTIGIFIGNGDGTFQAPENYPAGRYPEFATAVDLNLDGMQDLAVAESEALLVLFGNGNGTFEEPVEYDVGFANPAYVQPVFLTEEFPDLVALDGEGSIIVLINRGDGTFEDPVLYFGTGTGADVFSAVDVNDDGAQDLVTVDPFSNSTSVLLGNGDGTFEAGRFFPVNDPTGGLGLADINGDGNQDALVSAENPPSVRMMLGDGAGAFNDAGSFLVPDYPGKIVAGDMNGDGATDVVVEHSVNDSISIHLNGGDGTFEMIQEITIYTYRGPVALGDLNADDVLDLVTADNNDNVVVMLGRGDGTVEAGVLYPSAHHIEHFFAVDMNGDGVLDVVGVSGEEVVTLLGNGDGTLQDDVTVDVFATIEDAVMGDINGDGWLDVIAGSYWGEMLIVLPGIGDGTFAPTITYSHSALHELRSVALGDIDRDGMPDIVANNLDDEITFFPGNGDGTVRDATTFFAAGLNRVEVLDLNGDHKLDFMGVDSSRYGIEVILQRSNDSAAGNPR